MWHIYWSDFCQLSVVHTERNELNCAIFEVLLLWWQKKHVKRSWLNYLITAFLLREVTICVDEPMCFITKQDLLSEASELQVAAVTCVSKLVSKNAWSAFDVFLMSCGTQIQ